MVTGSAVNSGLGIAFAGGIGYLFLNSGGGHAVATRPKGKVSKAAPRPRTKAKLKKAIRAPKKPSLDLAFVRALLKAYLKHFRKELQVGDKGLDRLMAALRRPETKRRMPRAG
jgi:hypothetical protein